MSESKVAQPEPVWHEGNLDAAIERARRIKGVVIKSTPPDDQPMQDMGFWSDSADTMIRAWERVVWSYSDEQARADEVADELAEVIEGLS